jgi:hypothetical protein
MSVMTPNYPIRFLFAPHIVVWRNFAVCKRKSMTEPVMPGCGDLPAPELRILATRREGPQRPSGVILVPWLTDY